jgi:ABC-type branched-subunit amino acid transport system ATPase component
VPILEVEGLTAGYTRIPVISDVCLTAYKSRVSAVLGPNGSGKSTMLKAIIGLLGHEGKVVHNGETVSGWPTHRIVMHGLGYVPQVQNVFPSLTVLENLEAGTFFRRTTLRHGLERAFEMFPDLKQAAGKKAGTLSGGQRRMLAIARVLMSEPTVVILDEPTAGLAPNYVETVWQRVRDIAKTGAAVLVVEQNVELALRNSDFVDVLVGGRCVISGTAVDARNQDLAAIFLGALGSISSHQQSSDRSIRSVRQGQSEIT